jgi:hypothetical protein
VKFLVMDKGFDVNARRVVDKVRVRMSVLVCVCVCGCVCVSMSRVSLTNLPGSYLIRTLEGDTPAHLRLDETACTHAPAPGARSGPAA